MKKLNFQKADFTISYGISSQLPPSDNVEVAFAGRSNVGKSSAINKIFARKSLARVSCSPGKTATINFYRACPGVDFVDLPGYGYAKVSKSEKERWSELIEGYFAQERNLRIVIQLLDMRHPPTEQDAQMMNFLIENEVPFIVALTKCDKLNKTQTAARLSKIRDELPNVADLTIIPFSSETGQGVLEVVEILENVLDDEEELM